MAKSGAVVNVVGAQDRPGELLLPAAHLPDAREHNRGTEVSSHHQAGLRRPVQAS